MKQKQRQHDGKGQSYSTEPTAKSSVTHAQTGHDGGRTTKKGGTNRSSPQKNHPQGGGMATSGHCKGQGQKSNTGCQGGY